MMVGGSASAASLAAASPLVSWAFSNVLGITGALIALTGLLVNLHFRRQADKRHAERHLRHAARAEMQIAVAKQAMELREEARQQKKDEWTARMEFMKVTGRVPPDPPPTDWAELEELQFPSDDDQDRLEDEQADRDGN